MQDYDLDDRNRWTPDRSITMTVTMMLIIIGCVIKEFAVLQPTHVQSENVDLAS